MNALQFFIDSKSAVRKRFEEEVLKELYFSLQKQTVRPAAEAPQAEGYSASYPAAYGSRCIPVEARPAEMRRLAKTSVNSFHKAPACPTAEARQPHRLR